MSDTLYAQDWGNIEKYTAANDTLDAPAENENRTIFFGNSITEYWTTLSPSFFEENPNFIGRGISGQTTPQMMVRFRADVVELEPKMVVILAGINDIAENTGPIPIEQIAGNIFSMAEIAKANGIEVVLCSVLPAKAIYWREGLEHVSKVIALNRLIEAYATKHELRYVDYYSKMVDDKNGMQDALADDGLHPNKAGYAVMEKVFLEKE